jgi:hypothetical protein
MSYMKRMSKTDNNRCPAFYDKTKQCVLVKDHGGEHYAEWRAAMWFPCDRDCRCHDCMD